MFPFGSEDAPFFVKDYSEYYKGRCYHKRSLNSNDGWNSIGCMSFYESANIKYTVMKSEVQSLSFMEKKHTAIILEKMLMKI